MTNPPMPAKETSFSELAGVPVHYDRLDEDAYGTKGIPYVFHCTNRLKNTLTICLNELFNRWPHGQPELILSAGTVGDGENQHGKGLAFDLDGFYLSSERFMMDEYPNHRLEYIGINAHLFLYFPQVLSYHYPNHRDHFHVDFNFSMAYRTASNAQTFFVQSALVYLFDQDLGTYGTEKDGVDGIYGDVTRTTTLKVLKTLNLDGQGGLTEKKVWKEFLTQVRDRCFSSEEKILFT